MTEEEDQLSELIQNQSQYRTLESINRSINMIARPEIVTAAILLLVFSFSSLTSSNGPFAAAVEMEQGKTRIKRYQVMDY